MTVFIGDDWAIVPGPNVPDDGNVMSDTVSALLEISPAVIASVVVALPGSSVSHSESWWDWRATIEQGGEWLELEMTLMGEREELWGGFVVAEVSDPTILANVAEALAVTIDGIWLHSADCRMWKAERFRAVHCGQPV